MFENALLSQYIPLPGKTFAIGSQSYSQQNSFYFCYYRGDFSLWVSVVFCHFLEGDSGKDIVVVTDPAVAEVDELEGRVSDFWRLVSADGVHRELNNVEVDDGLGRVITVIFPGSYTSSDAICGLICFNLQLTVTEMLFWRGRWLKRQTSCLELLSKFKHGV